VLELVLDDGILRAVDGERGRGSMMRTLAIVVCATAIVILCAGTHPLAGRENGQQGLPPRQAELVEFWVRIVPLTAERIFTPPRRPGEKPYIFLVSFWRPGGGGTGGQVQLVLFAGEHEDKVHKTSDGLSLRVRAQLDSKREKAAVEATLLDKDAILASDMVEVWLPSTPPEWP
jgi:hypothetical protein